MMMEWLELDRALREKLSNEAMLLDLMDLVAASDAVEPEEIAEELGLPLDDLEERLLQIHEAYVDIQTRPPAGS